MNKILLYFLVCLSCNLDLLRAQNHDFANLCGRNIITDRDFINRPRAVRPDGDNGDPLGTWPWMASIGKASAGEPSWEHRCGGALLNDRNVVTAAHCVEGAQGRRQQLRFGDRNVSSSADDRYVQIRGIKRVHLHPDYDFETAYHDVAVLELSSPVRLTNQIRPLCLPPQTSEFVNKYQKVHVKMTGWGKESRDKAGIDGMLQTVPLKIFSHRYCQDTHWAGNNTILDFQIRRSLPQLFTESVLCAGDEGGGYGSCDGDSGSPIVIFEDEFGSETTKYTMVGMVQGGLGICGDRRFPGIYIRMEDASILSFVRSIVTDSFVNQPEKVTTTTASPDWPDTETDLFQLAFIGDLEGIRREVRNGADVNKVNPDVGMAAIHGATDVEVVKFLIESGASVDLRSENFEKTALHIAVGADEALPLVEYLVDGAGADVNAKDHSGNTPIIFAAAETYDDDVILFLARRGANIDAANQDGWTALMFAAFNDRIGSVRTLISLGADVEVKNNVGETALYIAAANANAESGKILLTLGRADANAQRVNGVTPLGAAIITLADMDFVRLLVERGADVNHAAQYYGQTPIVAAAMANRVDVLRFLVEERGVDPGAATSYGFTPLWYAAEEGSLEAARYLISRNVYVSAAEPERGTTPLHRAAFKGHLEIAKVLVQAGAQVNARAKVGSMTPLGMARAAGHAQVQSYLESVGGI